MTNNNYASKLYRQTLLRLGEMLKILKQGDNPDNRNTLQAHCEYLSNKGKQKNLFGWVELMETAKLAIANPNNEYDTTVKLIITEIKQAGEKLLKPEENISVSRQLLALVPELRARLMDMETVHADLSVDSARPDQQSTLERDLWRETYYCLTQVEEQIEADDSLNEWFDDDDSIDESEAISAVFLQEQDPKATLSQLTVSEDNVEQINSLFPEAEQENNLEIDQWSNVKANQNIAEEGESDLKVEQVEAHPQGYVKDLIIYDDFDDLASLLQSDNCQKLSIPSSWASLLESSPILYYEDFSELDKLINSAVKKSESINWQELELIIDDELHLTANALSRLSQLDRAEIDPELDDLDRLLNVAIKNQSPEPKKWNAKTNNLERDSKKAKVDPSMRVSVKQLDNLNNLVGELVVRRNRLEEDQERLRQFLDNLLSHVQNLSDVGARMQDLYERSLLEGALIASRERNQAIVKAQLARVEGEIRLNSNNGNSDYAPNLAKATDTPKLDVLELDRFTGFHLLSQEIIELIVRVRESTSDIQFLVDETEQLGRNLRQVTTQLQEGINQSRMVPFAQNADRLPLPIRKIAQGYNKQVQLKVEGREVLIDKMILEHLWDPLLQLAKNSVTHGIEQPEMRGAMGKPAMGTITVRAFLQGPQTVISVSDDGAGIDPLKIKQKAIQKQLITPAQAREMKEQEVYDLLFSPGFTTKEKADSHAGRGVGLDIVRSKLNEIRGSVSVDSTLGEGTNFTIRLPLTLTIGKALCCLNDNGRIAFPMDGIEDTKEYSVSEIKVNAQGQKCIQWYDTLLPYRPLSTLLSYNRQLSRSIIYSNTQEEETVSIVVLRAGSNLLAIQVDQVLGQEEIVIKQINGPLPKPKGIAGATVRSDGIIMPIGDVIELMEIAQGKLRKNVNLEADKQQTVVDLPVNNQPLVLIVDDSITVREMLSISFSKSGYRVEQARDGQEAWQKLRSGLLCDLVFCDIEMPRMNGLELLQHMQEDAHLADVPVAILSSRGAEKHQRIAAELGASGYLIKPYVEKDLLDSAQRMLQGEVLLAGSTKIPKPKNTNSDIRLNQDTSFPIRQKSKSSPLVLIIDDSVVVREMLSMTFKKAGYQVEQARDGQDAWEKVVGGLPCDVILCDIEMPRMNGLELLAKMQQDDNLAKIPVAMVTSRGAEKHRKIAADLGAKAYFTKPYLEEELLKATEGLIAGEVFF
jgi:chemosensory pili system protein ChpA (sensor histidine kinase/response regulator)